MSTLWKFSSQLQLIRNILQPKFKVTEIAQRGSKRINPPPRKRLSPWLKKPEASANEILAENITEPNKEFIQEVLRDKYPVANSSSPLKIEPIEPQAEWTRKSRRCGLLAKKIGTYPMWYKNGEKVVATLLQVLDNHVIKYISPENYNPMIGKPKVQVKTKLGAIIVGSNSHDPQFFTKEYSDLFKHSGLMPKKVIGRFTITEDAALQPGTPLFATHYKPGDVVDVVGKTTDRGFQGVMKRWGFKGMPATHGQTKTHRRPGNIGAGGERARVIPGTKMPGHMGNRYRAMRGLKILRVNTKYNVLFVQSTSVPGELNNTVKIFDTILPLRKFKEAPAFPTYFPTGEEPEDLYLDDIHPYGDPSIEFEETQTIKK